MRRRILNVLGVVCIGWVLARFSFYVAAGHVKSGWDPHIVLAVIAGLVGGVLGYFEHRKTRQAKSLGGE